MQVPAAAGGESVSQTVTLLLASISGSMKGGAVLDEAKEIITQRVFVFTLLTRLWEGALLFMSVQYLPGTWHW